MTKIEYITWYDHYSDYGWFDIENVKPDGHLKISVGFLVHEDNLYVSLAQTKYANGSTVADLLHILKSDILSREVVN